MQWSKVRVEVVEDKEQCDIFGGFVLDAETVAMQKKKGLDPQMVHIKWPQLLQTAVRNVQHAALCTKTFSSARHARNLPRCQNQNYTNGNKSTPFRGW